MLTTGTANPVVAYEIKAPYLGADFELYCRASASTISFGSCTTDIIFVSEPGSAAGSTLKVEGVSLAGWSMRLRGLSSAAWGVTGMQQNSSLLAPDHGVTGASAVDFG